MPDVIPLRNDLLQLQYQGVSSIKDFYVHMWRYFRGEGYVVKETGQWVINKGAVKDVSVKWTCTKPRDDGFTLFRINISMNFYAMKEVEALENGEKVKKDYCIHLHNWMPILVLDWKGEWSKHPLMKHFYNFYKKRIYGVNKPHYFGQFLQSYIEIDTDFNKLFNTQKKFLGMT